MPKLVYYLSADSHELRKAAQELKTFRDARTGKSIDRHPQFADIFRCTRNLDRAINKLFRQISPRPRPVDPEKDPEFAGMRRLRDAIRAMDKRLSRQLNLKELEDWAALMPEIDFENPQQVRRLAVVYVHDQVLFQSWQVCYRSNAPGRPLVRVDISVRFPGEFNFARYDHLSGGYYDYLVIATFPKWRICWKFSRHL